MSCPTVSLYFRLNVKLLKVRFTLRETVFEMSRRKLVDVSLFPEDSASSPKGAKIDPTPSVKDIVPVKSVSPVTEPVTVSVISKRRRFPKRPVCTDDIRSSPSPHPFVNTGGSISTSKELSKGRRASSLSSSFKNAKDITPMNPTPAPGSKYMLPFWPPSSGLHFKYSFRLLISFFYCSSICRHFDTSQSCGGISDTNFRTCILFFCMWRYFFPS